MGLGSFGGGVGAARYLAGLGARVLATDRRSAQDLTGAVAALDGLPIELALGGHRGEDFDRAELVVVNPAVPRDDPLLARARAAGARLTTEIELFLEAVRARVLLITGTQGKSSTAHMTHALLAGAGKRVHLGGNIGSSLLGALPEIGAEDVVVLEVSSYQLEALAPASADGPERARAEAVAVVNILPDHLERHGTLEAYAAAKRRILELLRPDGLAFLPADDPRFERWPVDGIRVGFALEERGQELCVRSGAFCWGQETLARVSDLALPGSFQRCNALVALGLARRAGVPPQELARILPGIRGLEHRLQDLGVVRGRRIFDNAVSTTPDSTISALRSLPPGGVLVLGGRRKNLGLEELARVAAEGAWHAVAFGQDGADFAAALRAAGVEVEVVPGVAEAIHRAVDPGLPGAHVLFSPAGSSFDSFANFQERARAFREALEELR